MKPLQAIWKREDFDAKRKRKNFKARKIKSDAERFSVYNCTYMDESGKLHTNVKIGVPNAEVRLSRDVK